MPPTCVCPLLRGHLRGPRYGYQPLQDDAGTRVGFMAILLDITERKQAERELLRERQSLQNVIEGTHVGWSCGTSSRIGWCRRLTKRA